MTKNKKHSVNWNGDFDIKNMKKDVKGITLIALVITIIILIILTSVGIYLSIDNTGIFNKTQQAKNETTKQAATEKMNLKITTAQINSYAEKQEMPTLKELSLILKEDNEVAYVTEESKVASAEYNVTSENPSTIYTKLKDYSYEFGINSSLQLASIDGVQIADNKNGEITLSKEQYESILNRLSALENYSTEEQAIGTWINGKTIYKKVIEFDTTVNLTSQSWTSIEINNLNIEKVITCNMIGTSNGMSIPITCQRIDTGIAVLNERNATYNTSGVILEYTKTID